MHHEMSLRPGPFAKIADGTKRYELRLHDEKRRLIAVGDTITVSVSASANSYLDFMKGRILSSLAEREFASLSADNTIYLKVKTTGNPVVWHFAPVKAGSVSVEEAIDRLEEEQRREDLLAFIGRIGMQEQTEWYQKLKECAWYRYPFENATQRPLKTSVSELKRRKMLEDGTAAQEAAVPAWVKQEKKEK